MNIQFYLFNGYVASNDLYPIYLKKYDSYFSKDLIRFQSFGIKTAQKKWQEFLSLPAAIVSMFGFIGFHMLVGWAEKLQDWAVGRKPTFDARDEEVIKFVEEQNKKLKDAVTDQLSGGLPIDLGQYPKSKGIGPTALFMMLDELSFYIRSILKHCFNDTEVRITISREGELNIGGIRMSPKRTSKSMAGASRSSGEVPVSCEVAEDLLRNWIPKVLLHQPKLLMDFEAKNCESTITFRKSKRSSIDELADRWRKG